MLQKDKDSSRVITKHMKYGLEHEECAIGKYANQCPAGTVVEKCGLYVDTENGQLAASPDRMATVNGERVVIEVKCLSASRTLTPRQAVVSKQTCGHFPFKMINDETIILKEKHKYFTQVQMQMAITGCRTCHVVIFTNVSCPVEIVKVRFDDSFWNTTKLKLLDFHSAYIVPALVNEMFK